MIRSPKLTAKMVTLGTGSWLTFVKMESPRTKPLALVAEMVVSTT